MDLMDAIYTRRSVRRYTKDHVDKSTVQKLLEAASEAPSASNSQPWSFVVIQDSAALQNYSIQAKKHLLSLVPFQPRLEKYIAILNDKTFNIFYDAGTLIIIYARPESPMSHGDCCLAGQNLMLAAHNQGLATCWIGFATALLDLEYIKASLGVPLNYSVVAPIVVGHPQGKTPHPRRNKPDIICWR